MNVVVAGAAGRTGRLVVEQLLHAGHQVTAVVRRQSQADDLVAAGAVAAVLDLVGASDELVADLLEDADAVVYAAGSSYGDTDDVSVAINGSAPVRWIDTAAAVGVRRFVMVSAHRVDEDFGDAATLTYLRAKRAADAHLRRSTLTWAVVRPDALTDEPPTGLVEVGARVPRGAVPRADLAAVVVACLSGPSGRQFELVSGEETIAAALADLPARLTG